MAEAGHQRPNGEATPRRHHAPTPQAAPSGPTVSGPPSIASGGASVAAGSPAGGQPLAQPVRQTLEGSFNVDLGHVRVYNDSAANQAATNLSARAFTYGPQIFLGSGERPTDLGLMAHEVAHVVQQGQAPVVQRSAIQRRSKQDVAEREAEQAVACVTTGATVHVEHRVDRPQVQRLGLSDVLDYFAEKAYLIPGFRMFTIVLGFNPINMQRAERSAANILRAFIEFLPGGNLITQALDAYGILEKVGAWVEQQLGTLGDIGAAVRRAISSFLDSLSFSDIFHLGDVWDRAKRIFTDPIDRIISFAKGLVTGIIGFIKDAILQPLAKLAEGTRGYDLLKAVLGRDPITGEPVPRNADTLIGGFMKLIGQEEVWTNIKRANAIPRAWAWFQGALEGLLGFVRQIPSLFLSALRQLELFDIVVLPRAFIKLGRVFGGFIGDFLSWAGRQVLSLLQIIFEVIAPSVMPYLRKAAGAFRMIIQNPIGFIGNLVRAGIQGFKQFAANFLNHLKKSLIDWLTGTLVGAGVYIPQALELREIIKFVLSVLGLTWQNLRGKLAKVIGEPAVKALETGFDLVVTLVRDGPAAAWDKIRESLSNLREMVMDGIMAFVRDRIVQAAITRLITSLNPAGAFIQAIIAIYNTVMFFVERLRQIAQVVASFIDSIAAIASGNIGTAANRVETTMGGLLTLVISFLARLVGLGKVSDAIKNILDRVRAPIDRALERVADWISTMAKRAGKFIAQAGVPQDPNERLRLAAQAAVAAARRLTGRVTAGLLSPVLQAIQVRYGLRELAPFEQQGSWWVRATVNPTTTQNLGVPSTTAAGAAPASADPQIRVYEQILTALHLPLIQAETNPDRYRDKMRQAIVAAYKSKPITALNDEVFKSGVIPRAQNRIRGDIFELWLEANSIIQRQSPIFESPTLYKRRIADGVRGTDKLVDAKVRRPNIRPDPEARRQMEDYQTVITGGLKAINVSDTVEKGPFKAVIYIFADKSLIPLWQPDLNRLVTGHYEAE